MRIPKVSRDGRTGSREFLLAISAGLFAFGGWHQVTYAAGETIDAAENHPARAVGRHGHRHQAVISRLNAAYLTRLAAQDRAQFAARCRRCSGGPGRPARRRDRSRAGHRFRLRRLERHGARTAREFTTRSPRTASHGAPWASRTPRFQTPHVAIVAQAIWASALVATGTYRALFTRVVYTEFLFFGLMAIGLMRLEKRWSAVALLFIAGLRRRGRQSARRGLEGIRYRPVDGRRRVCQFIISLKSFTKTCHH